MVKSRQWCQGSFVADPGWLQPMITGAATLAGAALGAIGTYFAQRDVWQRQYSVRWDEARRVAYSRLLTSMNEWHDAIVTSDSERAEGILTESLQLTGEVSLLSTDATRQAATEYMNYVYALHKAVIREGGRRPPGEFEGYAKVRDEFRRRARSEMKII
jgi:hypothetical protein